MREFLVKLKNTNPFLLYIWTKQQQKKGKINLAKFTDKEAIINLYLSYAGRKPNLTNPSTFSEKLQWLKLNYQNPLQTIGADKFLVRDYLINKGYESILSKVILVAERVEDLNINTLPEKFVIKATHGSGWNLICTDKKKVNWFWWRKIMNIWLHNNIFWPGREWPYKNMKPRLIVEEFMTDKSGLLMDYKFFCFNGKAKFVQANKGRDTPNHAQNFYDLEWKILPFGKDLKPRPDINIDAPSCLNQMIEIAQDLATEFPFVRVDFYEVNGKVIFGELTFYPKGGLPDFTPPEYDEILGSYFELPNSIT
jgi:hypothetical protein